MLSAIIEKNNLKEKRDVTTVNMPSGIIEGSETIIVFSLMFLFKSHLVNIFNK